MKNHETKNIKADIYYEYIVLNKYNEKFHLINIENGRINMLIPTNYRINYSLSNNLYKDSGRIEFNNDKYTYSIDYYFTSFEKFNSNILNQKKYIKKEFINYKKQKFYEIDNNNEYIYMYYEGICFKLCANHKMSLNEYYDMYLVLFSIVKDNLVNNKELLKEICFYHMNCIGSICSNLDLIVSDLSACVSSMELNKNDIKIECDEAFLEYKKLSNKVDLISKKFLSDILNDTSSDEKTYIIDFGKLGTYSALVFEYNEIIDSNELNLDEKNKMIMDIIYQKQNEVNNNQVKINNQFYDFISTYIKNNLTYDLWNMFHIREFVDKDKIDFNNSDYELYFLFKKAIDSKKIIDETALYNSIKSIKISVYPSKYILRLTALNGFLNNFKLIYDDEFNLLG